MPDTYLHLELQREQPITEKRPRRPAPPPIVDDPAAHGRFLSDQLSQAKVISSKNVGGYDERLLFRFDVQKGFNPDALQRISPEIEFVSQEGDKVVVAFLNETALQSFEARLSSLANNEEISYRQVIYALENLGGWTSEDRTGWALRRNGIPSGEQFSIDVELWPIEGSAHDRERLCEAFEVWISANHISMLDRVKQPGLLLYRVRCNQDQTRLLLNHRDIRTVDLPPHSRLELRVVRTDIQSLPTPPAPPSNAPGIAVLDTGIVQGHPCLSSVVQDARSYIAGADCTDDHGHGTLVSGIAIYGDIYETISRNRFVPELKLYSGRILNESGESPTAFIENHVENAVRDLVSRHSCKIFNLSFGDLNKPYIGGHIRGLAYTLDALSRELGILFIVSAGNVLEAEKEPSEWRDEYPGYFSSDEWRLIDPAPSLNALVVGSIARYDQTFSSQRYSGDPSEIPIARRDQPSPFTRCGPSIGGAIKPDVVAYGGNWALNTRAGYITNQGLGELSTCKNFVDGRPFSTDCGTSLAAPYITHLAGRILKEYPNADGNLIRALIVAHATIPATSLDLLQAKERWLYTCGYGKVDATGLLRSLESLVTLTAETTILDKRHHFYEIPIPDDFVSSGARTRELSIALSYTPVVKSTRINYRATRMEFKLVAAESLENVVQTFNKATMPEDFQNIPEVPGAIIGSKLRVKGTVQSDTWRWRITGQKSILRNKRIFVVVTRNDHPWGVIHADTEEKYALVVSLKDSKEQSRLYTQLRQRLQTRMRGRARL